MARWQDSVPRLTLKVSASPVSISIFIREDKQAGGHALNYQIRSGRLQLAGLHGLHVELPTSAAFLKANFQQGGLDDKIKASEG